MSFEQDPFSTPPRTSAPGPQARHPGRRLHGNVSRARHQGVTAAAHYAATHAATPAHPHAAAVTAHAKHPIASHRNTRLHLKARAGAQRIEVGTIISYNPSGNTALVRLI